MERTTGLDMARSTLLGEQKKLDLRIEQLCKDLYQLELNRAKYEEELRILHIKNMGIADALIGIRNQAESLKEVAEKYPAPEFLGKLELPPDASEKVKQKEYGFWETRYQDTTPNEKPEVYSKDYRMPDKK